MEQVECSISTEYTSSYEGKFHARKKRNHDPGHTSRKNEAGFSQLLNKDTALEVIGHDTMQVQESGKPFTSELDSWLSNASMKLTQGRCEVYIRLKVSMVLHRWYQMIAKDCMAVTNTSIPSECAFYRSGTTARSRRTSLADDAIQPITKLQWFINFNCSFTWADPHVIVSNAYVQYLINQ